MKFQVSVPLMVSGLIVLSQIQRLSYEMPDLAGLTLRPGFTNLPPSRFCWNKLPFQPNPLEPAFIHLD